MWPTSVLCVDRPIVLAAAQETVEKAKLSKLLIESHYTNMQRDRKERMNRRRTLEQQLEQLQCSSEERCISVLFHGSARPPFSLYVPMNPAQVLTHTQQI